MSVWKDAKLSNKMKKALKDCFVGSYRQVAICVAMLSNRLANVHKVDVSAAPTLDTSLAVKTVNDSPTTVSKGLQEPRAV